MDIQVPQILFQIINFGVVVAALSFLLYKPLQKVFEERASRIAAAQKAAEENLAEQEKLEQYKKKVKHEAEKQATAILEEAKEKAEERKRKIMAEAKTEAEQEREKLVKEWQAEKNQLLQSLHTEMVDAVVSTAEKVVGSALDKKAHSKLIDQEINAIAKTL